MAGRKDEKRIDEEKKLAGRKNSCKQEKDQKKKNSLGELFQRESEFLLYLNKSINAINLMCCFFL